MFYQDSSVLLRIYDLVSVVVMVVATLVQMGIDGNNAPGVRDFATGVLKLDRRMVNVETPAQYLLHATEDTVALGRWHIVDEHMAA